MLYYKANNNKEQERSGKWHISCTNANIILQLSLYIWCVAWATWQWQNTDWIEAQ